MYQIYSVYKVLGLLFNTSESSHLFLKCESVFCTYHIKVSTQSLYACANPAQSTTSESINRNLEGNFVEYVVFFINNNNNLVYLQKLAGTSTFNILVVYSNLKELSSFSKKGQLFNVFFFFFFVLPSRMFFHINLFVLFRVSSKSFVQNKHAVAERCSCYTVKQTIEQDTS